MKSQTKLRNSPKPSKRTLSTLLLGTLALCSGVVSINAQEDDLDDLDQVFELPEFQVSGIGAAITRAQIIKEQAPVVLEAISFEDLGQFSDDNLADALQRVPGVQIERDESGIEGDRVSIRGIGPQFVTVSINGRTPMSSGGEGIRNLRQFNLNTIAPEVIGGVLVYKTPEAALIEPGLGGAVDILTLKPLNIKKGLADQVYGNFQVRSSYDDLSGSWNPRYSGILSWKNKDQTFGAYVAGMYAADQQNARDEVFIRWLNNRPVPFDTDGDGAADETKTLRVPNNISHNPIRTSLDQTGISAAIQWKPADNFEINLDYFATEFTNNSQRNLFRPYFNVGGSAYHPSVVWDASKTTIANDTIVAFEAGAFTPRSRGFRTQLQNLKFDNRTKDRMIGFNLKWGDAEDLLLTVDLATSDMEFEQDLRTGGNFRSDTGTPFDHSAVSYDAITGPAPAFTFGYGPNDVSNYGTLGMFIREGNTDGSNDSALIDLQKKFNPNLTGKIGMRYSASEIDSRSASSGIGVPAEDQPGLMATLTGDLIPDPFLSGILPEGAFNQWLAVDYDAVADAIPGILKDVTAWDDGIFDGSLRDAVDGELPLDRGTSFVTEEDTTAVYGQLDFRVNSFLGMPLSGNIGARIVDTNMNSIGYTQVTVFDPDPTKDLEDGVDDYPDSIVGYVPTEVDSSYTEVLPSLNLNLEVAERQRLRMGVSKVISRPTFLDMAPRNSIRFRNPDVPYEDGADPDPTGEGGPSGQAGNPYLDPYSAIQYDLTYELYTENGGAFYASFFYKDVADFILTQSVLDVPIDAPDDITLDGVDIAPLFEQPVDSSIPVNYSDGTVKGFEIGMNQPLTFLPFDGFGAQANYTYVDSEFDKDIGDGGFGFPGSSSDNFNAVIYYEGHGLSVRMAYTYRNDYLQSLGIAGSDRSAENTFTEGSENVSLSVNYKISKSWSVGFTATNLTGENRRQYLQVPEVVQNYATRPQTYIFRLRYEFGVK